MKLQDLHPYDSFIVGMNNIYYIDYKGNFHINATFILAANKTLCTGITYVLISPSKRTSHIVHQVRLQDAYYTEGIINLVLQDILSKETFTLDQQMKCIGDHFNWVLIDLDYLVEELNTEIIKSYCLKCTDAK